MMKLSLRSIETEETLTVELPSSSSPTLHQLEQLVFQSIPPPIPSALYFKFNLKEPPPPLPHDSLTSLGVTSGDLIYFSTTPLLDYVASSSLVNQNQILVDDSDTQMGENQKREVSYLNKALIHELGCQARDYRFQVVVAVHAVMSDYGFLRFHEDSASKLSQHSASFTSLSFRYRPLELWGKIDDCVVLRFHSLGHFVMVYGYLANTNGASLHHISMDKYKIAPILDLVHANNCDLDQKDLIEKEVLELWKTIKDELTYPLSIDICYSIGVALPPCFMGLPNELKVKILEALPGVDLAKMECVSKEIKSLVTNALWKQKCVEEFQIKSKLRYGKKTFAKNWARKNMNSRRFHDLRTDLLHQFGGLSMVIGNDYGPHLGVPPF
ncbi:hypothetical protein ACFE04_007448 [Oxalis oulophora]